MRFESLLSRWGTAKMAYKASEKELEKVLGKKLTLKFAEFRRKFNPEAKLTELKNKKIIVLPKNSSDYPEPLKNITDPPICLYLKGNISSVKGDIQLSLRSPVTGKQIETPIFAIVGTRLPTVYGQQIAYKLSRELADAGFTIVSGLARGVDAVAHQAALDVGGKTVAVLGCGVDIVYPAENYDLYEKIIETGGAILSEFPPGHMVVKGLFIARNRIISGLARGVLIVEGSSHSGALITAKYAGEQGKDIFAVPSAINSDMSQAPNLLIKQGAKLVTCTQDIFDEFNITITPKKQEEIEKTLDSTEQKVFDFIKIDSKSADEIALSLKAPVSQILNTISMMEIKGIVEKNSGNKYQVRI